MAKQLSFVSVDTPISGVTTNPINLELINFGADFVEKTDSKKGEVIITNIKAPVSAPETFRFAVSPIDDAYRGSSVEPSMRAITKKGVSILVQHNIILKETDTTDATYEAYVPVKVHTVLAYPNVETLTATLAEKIFRRHAAGLYETGKHDEGRLASLLRGSLLPPDVK